MVCGTAVDAGASTVTATSVARLVPPVTGRPPVGAYIATSKVRDRLQTEAHGHRQELEANAAKARESQEQAEAHRSQFEQHRDDAERLRREAEEKERLAEEHAATASELDGRGERARAAANRHDERASDAEERLDKLR